MDESGTTDTFDVVLQSEPTSNVVFNVVSDDIGEATVDQATLTFIPSLWDTPQTVIVTGVDDNRLDLTQSPTITISVDAGSDPVYVPLGDQAVSVTVTDDDVAGFTIVEEAGATSVTEAGSSDTYTVVLDAEPSADVVINVVSADTGEATVDVSSLTFSFSLVNWNVPQTVTVTGVDDDIDDGDEVTVITMSIDAGSDGDFLGVADQTVDATTVDDDTAGFTVTESSGSTDVDESGTMDTFDVVLLSEPTSNVVFTVVSDDVGEATVDQATLTFIPSLWDTPQTITVTGIDDLILDGTQFPVVTIAVDDDASDDLYDLLADETVTVSVTDDETNEAPSPDR